MYRNGVVLTIVVSVVSSLSFPPRAHIELAKMSLYMLAINLHRIVGKSTGTHHHGVNCLLRPPRAGVDMAKNSRLRRMHI